MNHVKYRDHSVKRNRGIGGCHDLNEWNNLRQVPSGTAIPVGKDPTDASVPEVLIRSENAHPVAPGVKMVDYNIPTLDRTTKTDGSEKVIGDPKTVYDPSVWPDDVLEQSLKEAMQNVADNNGGTVPVQWTGQTASGISLMGFVRGGQLQTFFFA